MFPTMLDVMAIAGGLGQGPPAHDPPTSAIEYAAACPGPVIHPFQRLPKVTPVGECRDGQPGEPRPSPAGGEWVKEFAKPARFPLPRFDQCGQPVSADGLVIYEGMRLVVNPQTGIYDVSFTGTVPSTPVTLRLQLTLRHHDTAAEYTLTLPPIQLRPDANAKPGDESGNTFHVHHRGYSSRFHVPVIPATPPRVPDEAEAVQGPNDCCNPAAGRIDCTWWAVTRTGTARFGTPLATDDAAR